MSAYSATSGLFGVEVDVQRLTRLLLVGVVAAVLSACGGGGGGSSGGGTSDPGGDQPITPTQTQIDHGEQQLLISTSGSLALGSTVEFEIASHSDEKQSR